MNSQKLYLPTGLALFCPQDCSWQRLSSRPDFLTAHPTPVTDQPYPLDHPTPTPATRPLVLMEGSARGRMVPQPKSAHMVTPTRLLLRRIASHRARLLLPLQQRHLRRLCQRRWRHL